MPQCERCGLDTECGLCWRCQYEDGLAYHDEQEITKTNDFLCNLKFHHGVIKGRIAEALIEQLFISMGYNVYRYGMENTVPGIMKLLKGVRSDVAEDIKRMPDFVVQKGQDVFFIEVKFRANEKFSEYDLPENYPYDNAYIVVVSKKHIKCLTVKEMKEEHKTITPNTSSHYLGDRNEFDLDRETINYFCKFAVKFFENV